MENDLKLRVVPPVPNIHDTDGFSNKSDIFGYAEFGGRLANIVYNMVPPFVLALTGGWGSGKSVFAKQWAGELRRRWVKDGENRKAEDAPVIYFDAFANDHQENSLFALAGEVMEFIGRRGQGKSADGVRESADLIAKGVGSVMAEGIARYVTSGLVGAADIACAMESALKKRLKEAEQDRYAVQEFRKALEKAAKELGGGHPLVFIVDELDRCRPDFALDLLEKIKHLFSVPNVCFLVVTNLDQFGAVVQRAYGYDKEAASVYLDKFFHHIFRLPELKGDRGQSPVYVRHLWENMNLPYEGQEREDFISWLTKLAEKHNFSLRDIERIFASVALVCAAISKPKRAADKDKVQCLIFALAGLCAMRKGTPDLYRKAQAGLLTAGQFEQFTGHKEWERLGIMPKFIKILTGEISSHNIESDSRLRRVDFGLQMPELTHFIEGFEVRNQFWEEESPPSE